VEQWEPQGAPGTFCVPITICAEDALSSVAGTGWELVVDCGWAQNFPFSASCLNTQPYPVCQNN
jgi:hypothetical protein